MLISSAFSENYSPPNRSKFVQNVEHETLPLIRASQSPQQLKNKKYLPYSTAFVFLPRHLASPSPASATTRKPFARQGHAIFSRLDYRTLPGIVNVQKKEKAPT
jgi:hypothetical protein